jgi:hypothetical protein
MVTDWARRSLVLVGLLALAGAVGSMFHAGCVGDTKSGALGDPIAAIRIEGYSILLGMFGCIVLAGSASMLAGASISKRIISAIGVFMLCFIVLAAGGIEAEVLGVQHCHRVGRPDLR